MTQQLTIGIVEDEMVIAEEIREILLRLGYRVPEPCISYGMALEMLETEAPDLVICDIQLAGKKDGIHLAHKIRSDFDIPFIFLTSNADKATVDRAKAVNPPAYLIKPFNEEDLYSSIEIALANHQEAGPTEAIGNRSIFLKNKGLHHRVQLSEISFLKSDSGYVEIYLADGRKFLVRSSLSDYMDTLNHPDLMRIHRSHAVNHRHVDAVNALKVVIKGEELSIGASYQSDLQAKLGLS